MTQSWITTYGWQSAYRLLALTAVCLGGVAWVLLFATRESRAAPRPPSGTTTAPINEALGDALGVTLRTARFWLVAFVLFIVSAAGLGAAVHVAALFSDRGMAPELAARAVALAGMGVMLGRLAAGGLMDVMHAPRVAAGAFFLGAAGLMLIASNPGQAFWVLGVGTLLFGFTVGTEGDFIPYLVRRYFGLKAFGATFGVLFCVYSLGGVVGPILFGISFDRLGTYTPALLAAAAACVVGGIAVLGLGRYRFSTPIP